MVNMVPHEAFACGCAEEDVVLRQSYKPESCETQLRQLMSSPGAPSAGPSTPSSYSSGPSTLSSFRTFNTSKLFFRIFKKCRVLKQQALAWKD
nr:hypothetical protein [Tanacetum cinerariifolium]